MKRHIVPLSIIALLVGITLFIDPLPGYAQALPTYGAPQGPAGPYNGAQLSAQSAQAAAMEQQRKVIELNYQRQRAIRDAANTYQNAIQEAQYRYQQTQFGSDRSPATIQAAAQTYQQSVRGAAKTYQDAIQRAQQMR